MIIQIKEGISKILFSPIISHLAISIFFFFAWVGLITKMPNFFWIFEIFGDSGYNVWIVLSWALLLPIILLVSATIYKSKLAYLITLLVFGLSILTTIVYTPIQFRQYYEIYNTPELMNNPLHAKFYSDFVKESLLLLVSDTLKLFACSLFAIYLMTRKRMLRLYGW